MNVRFLDLMKEKTKKRLKIILALALLNYAPIWISKSVALTDLNPDLNKKTIKHDKLAQKKYSNLDNTYGVKEYLVAANEITLEFKTKDMDCKNYTTTTKNVFEYIAKINNKSNLLDSIRYAMGSEDFGTIGHVWIQYKHNNKWNNYEPSKSMIQKHINKNNIKKYVSSKKFKYKSEINITGEETAVTLPGNSIFYPCSIKYFYDVGAIQVSIAMYRISTKK